MHPIALTIDVEDWYHGIPIQPSDKARAERRLFRSALRLLALLHEFRVHGTLFFLGQVVEEDPQLLRLAADQGHEIGCHGWSHDLVYEMTPERFREETRRSRDAIAAVTGSPPTAYRAPYFSVTNRSLWALEILADLGFRYDSSIFPAHNWRYGIPGFSQQPHWIETRAGRIGEFPLSVIRILGLNVPASGGAYFRLYPYWLTRFNLGLCARRERPAVFYLHPWELDPGHPRVRFLWKARLTH
jgi:polysaccharide deacetylase family protein (PEP-CTERM system associated)